MCALSIGILAVGGDPTHAFATVTFNQFGCGSTRLEDHYRDTTGWHVRTFPITGAAPLAMTFDANNAAHIFALAPSGNALQLNLVYIRIDATRWN